MRVEITVKSESTEQSRVTLDGRTQVIVIGRHGACELQSLSPSVSRRHAEFSWDGSRLVIKDLQSTTGTYVNDRRVDHAEVGLGDEVRCGQVQLSVKFVGHDSEGSRKGQGNTMVLEAYAPKDNAVQRQTTAPEMSASERAQREQDTTL